MESIPVEMRYSARRLLWAGPLIIGTAVLTNLLFFYLTKRVGAQYLISPPAHPLAPLPLVSILFPTLVASAGGVVIFGLLIKVSHVPLPPFLSVAAASLLVSFGGPFSLSPLTSLTTKLLLSAMNVLTALVTVGGLLVLARRKGGP